MALRIRSTYVRDQAGVDAVLGVVTDDVTYEWRFVDLFEAAQSAPTTLVELEVLDVLDDDVWFAGTDTKPTLRAVAHEVPFIEAADLSRPLLSVEGLGLIDGSHRVAKAYLQGVDRLPMVCLSLDALFELRHTRINSHESTDA